MPICLSEQNNSLLHLMVLVKCIGRGSLIGKIVASCQEKVANGKRSGCMPFRALGGYGREGARSYGRNNLMNSLIKCEELSLI